MNLFKEKSKRFMDELLHNAKDAYRIAMDNNLLTVKTDECVALDVIHRSIFSTAHLLKGLDVTMFISYAEKDNPANYAKRLCEELRKELYEVDYSISSESICLKIYWNFF